MFCCVLGSCVPLRSAPPAFCVPSVLADAAFWDPAFRCVLRSTAFCVPCVLRSAAFWDLRSAVFCVLLCSCSVVFVFCVLWDPAFRCVLRSTVFVLCCVLYSAFCRVRVLACSEFPCFVVFVFCRVRVLVEFWEHSPGTAQNPEKAYTTNGNLQKWKFQEEAIASPGPDFWRKEFLKRLMKLMETTKMSIPSRGNSSRGPDFWGGIPEKAYETK